MPKDACYHKVKARYRVFPSAYASGAIAKCRKVGAANYGKSSKKAKKKATGGVVKMAKRGRPKKVVEEKNSILSLIRKLIGTAKRKTFWDWLTGK